MARLGQRRPIGSAPAQGCARAARRAAVLVLSLLGFPAALAAAAPAGNPVAEAVGKTAAVPSMRVGLQVSIREAGAEELSFAGEGVADNRAKRGRTTIDLSKLAELAGEEADPGDLRLQVVYDASSGYVLYLRFPLLQRLANISKPWLKVDLVALGAQQGVDLSDLQLIIQGDPAQQLQYLRATTGEPRRVGRASVRGVRTTRYRATLDYGRVAAYAPPALRASMQAAARELIRQSGSRTAPVDVWIDGQGLIRRVALVQKAHGPPLVETSFVADFYDFGARVRVELPPPGQVADLTELTG